MDRRRFLGCIASAVAWPQAALAAAASRRLRFTLTFSNPLDRPLERQAFWCYLPASLAPSQRLQGMRVSMPHAVHSDPLGHQVLALAFEHFPALAQKTVTLNAEVELAPEGAAGTGNALAGREAWLGAERYIESDDAGIRALAAELRRPAQLGTARAIYDWVRTNLHYAGYLADDFGAVHALLNRRGDCTEYADLVVALARANGIPARMAGGYVAGRDAAPRAQDYHNWAQLYLDGTWRTVDAQKESWLAPENDYIVFRLYRDTPTNPVGSAHRYRIEGDLRVGF